MNWTTLFRNENNGEMEVRGMWARYGFRFKGATLSRDITVVLVVKAALLLMLWLVFFSNAPVPSSGDVAATVLGSGDSSGTVPAKIKP